MLLRKSHRAVVALALLTLGVAPMAHAVELQPAQAVAAHTMDGISYSSARVESSEGGARLVLAGNVVVYVPASMHVDFESDRVSRRAGGAEVFEGAVTLTIERSRIATERATVTRAANGDAVISMDQAQITRGG